MKRLLPLLSLLGFLSLACSLPPSLTWKGDDGGET